jgi:hypothetical protein
MCELALIVPDKSGVYRVRRPHFKGSREVKYLCLKINYRPNIVALRVEQSRDTLVCASGHCTGTFFCSVNTELSTAERASSSSSSSAVQQ